MTQAQKQAVIDEFYTKASLTEEHALDVSFMQRISQEVTVNGQLPFQVPIDHMPLIIHKCAEWYFRNCEDAVEEKWYVVKRQALVTADGLNNYVTLPHRIISVNETETTDAASFGTALGGNRNRFYRQESLMLLSNSWSQSSSMGYTGNAINGAYSSSYYDHIGDFMLGANALGAVESAFKRHYRSKYNRNSRRLNFLTQIPDSDFVLNVTERVNLYDLYDDDRFINYVTGHCLLQLGYILQSFEFKLPGGITINDSSFSARGQKLIDDVEKQIEEDGDSPIFLFS